MTNRILIEAIAYYADGCAVPYAIAFKDEVVILRPCHGPTTHEAIAQVEIKVKDMLKIEERRFVQT